jgi:hypothetical protein
MAYYVFLKSLRRLEEFRKNPHVKIPPKSASTNFQSLGKFKNPIFNSEILFLLILARPTLRPTQPLSPASPLATPSPTGRKCPIGPSSPRFGRVLAGNTLSFLDHAFPSRPPPPSVTTTWAPLVSFIVSPMPANPSQNFPRAAAPPRRCLTPWMPPRFYSSPSSLPPLIPLQTEC